MGSNRTGPKKYLTLVIIYPITFWSLPHCECQLLHVWIWHGGVLHLIIWLLAESSRAAIDILLKAAGYLDCAIRHVLPQIPSEIRFDVKCFFPNFDVLFNGLSFNIFFTFRISFWCSNISLTIWVGLHHLNWSFGVSYTFL